MESKEWYKSKGIIGGILVCLGVAGKVIASNEIRPEDVAYLGVGVSLIGIRKSLN